MAVLIKDQVISRDLKKIYEDHNKMINVVVDISNGATAIDSETHADAKQLLLDNGSQDDKLWGGSLDLLTKRIETAALINNRPELGNDSEEILYPETREKFIQIVKEKFGFK